MSLVLREGGAVVGIGIFAGTGIALALGKLVAPLLYEVTPRDPAVFMTAAAMVLAVGLLATALPAWRAGRVDPVKVLGGE